MALQANTNDTQLYTYTSATEAVLIMKQEALGQL
jgi:hypothetical protein